jgi:hypothetical protein
MRDIAERLKDIQHTDVLPRFHRISGIASLEELILNMQHTTGYQLLAEDNLNGRFSDNLAINWLNIRQYIFFVVKQADPNSPEEMETVKSGCFTVAKKVLSKIKIDRLTDHRRETDHGLRNLDTSSIRYSGVGPIGDHYYGVQVFFNVLDPAGIVYIDDDWNDIIS